ncbi:CRISPR-associated endonuclease/helicase Cas3 [bacterium HR10]|nr:CRISPR-associated endonuclease/helicase Cas3 [bacterium HR10]
MNVANAYNQCGINTPAPHQRGAWDALSRGQSIILRAPTGSGKTEAVVLPFLAFGGQSLAARLIYALPLRSLANQIVRRIEDYAPKLGSKPASFQVRLQHGEKPESVLFAADAVVATIDQVVTSYACTPLTLPVRHGNIPAGAVMSSFLVFDEMHLFDPELGLQATRLMCERLHRLGMPYAVLSATLPDSVVEFWQDNLGAEVIEADGEFVQRQVTVEWRDLHLNADEVKKALGQVHRILVVCNTVDQAVALYRQVASDAQTQGYACNLLHSRFLPEDRKRKEDWVAQHFGKEAAVDTKALLVATQVVGVGLDISADLLLTEVAPVDALIQRAGRVARWGGTGKVLVYDVESAAPYNRELVGKTKEVLQKESGCVLDWPTAKRWVNQVLNEPYRRILHESNAYEQVVAQLSRAAFEGSRSQAEAAVREINTVEVTLHSDPQRLGRDVLRLPTLSVHIGVAKKWVEEAKRANIQVWRVEVDRNPSDAQASVSLKLVSNAEDITIGDRLVFPPSLLGYSPDEGLQQAPNGQDFQPQSGQACQPLSSALRREGWIDHSVQVADAIEQILQQEQHAVSALAYLLSVPKDEIKKAAKLAALLHDLGKLNAEWQREAGISGAASPQDLLAHTDAREYVRFPPHATVSAYALWLAIIVDGGALPRLLAKAVCFAIAHHHSVRAKEVPAYKFHPKWKDAVKQALQKCGLNGTLNLNHITPSQPSPTDLREQFPPMECERLYTAYVLLSRWLRLADRIATGGPNAVLHYENWFGRL